MKKSLNKVIFTVFLLVICLTVNSQSIDTYFVNMPDGLIPTMTKKNRMELLEYHKVGQSDSILNRFGKMSYLQTFDTLNNLIVVKNTLSSSIELKLLKTKNGSAILGVIQSVCAPICQSRVNFYDTTWHKIPIHFNLPNATRWINLAKMAEVADLDTSWVHTVLQNSFISLCFDPQSPEIIATNNSAEFLSEVDKKVIQPILIPKNLRFELKGRLWVEKF